MRRYLATCAAALMLAPLSAVHAQHAAVSIPKAEAEQLLEAYALIKSQYVENVDDKKLFNDAIAGMLAALDPHSQLLGKEDLDQIEKETRASTSAWASSPRSTAASSRWCRPPTARAPNMRA